MYSLNKNSNNESPIISICIPTFNRAVSLGVLLENLFEIKQLHGNAVEICISNNHSTDDTQYLIDTWREKLALRDVTQPENIGATLNFLAVSKLASGKWILIVGDDDTINGENFSKLITYLKDVDDNDWILAGVADPAGKESLLGNLKSGFYDSSSSKKVVLQTGLYRYGFIGMHLFPASLQQDFAALKLEQVRPWPHLALFLRHIKHGQLRIFNVPVVQQKGAGDFLFWKIQDMAYIKLRKLNIIADARDLLEGPGSYYDFLMLRELYLARDIRTLLFWKALEPEDFNKNAVREYFSRYKLIQSRFAWLVSIHALLLLAARVIPNFLMVAALWMIGQRAALLDYQDKKKKLIKFSGIDRGI